MAVENKKVAEIGAETRENTNEKSSGSPYELACGVTTRVKDHACGLREKYDTEENRYQNRACISDMLGRANETRLKVQSTIVDGAQNAYNRVGELKEKYDTEEVRTYVKQAAQRVNEKRLSVQSSIVDGAQNAYCKVDELKQQYDTEEARTYVKQAVQRVNEKRLTVQSSIVEGAQNVYEKVCEMRNKYDTTEKGTQFVSEIFQAHLQSARDAAAAAREIDVSKVMSKGAECARELAAYAKAKLDTDENRKSVSNLWNSAKSLAQSGVESVRRYISPNSIEAPTLKENLPRKELLFILGAPLVEVELYALEQLLGKPDNAYDTILISGEHVNGKDKTDAKEAINVYRHELRAWLDMRQLSYTDAQLEYKIFEKLNCVHSSDMVSNFTEIVPTLNEKSHHQITLATVESQMQRAWSVGTVIFSDHANVSLKGKMPLKCEKKLEHSKTRNSEQEEFANNSSDGEATHADNKRTEAAQSTWSRYYAHVREYGDLARSHIWRKTGVDVAHVYHHRGVPTTNMA